MAAIPEPLLEIERSKLDVLTRKRLLIDAAIRMGGQCVFEDDPLSPRYGRLIGFLRGR